ncbi:hypothetical protein B0H10DRAFT_2094847, partial [Mycena sp. CBHHK59/15]
ALLNTATTAIPTKLALTSTVASLTLQPIWGAPNVHTVHGRLGVPEVERTAQPVISMTFFIAKNYLVYVGARRVRWLQIRRHQMSYLQMWDF